MTNGCKNTCRLCLIKGFVTLEKNPDSNFWFPLIIFYDRRGLKLFQYPQDSTVELYDALASLSGNNPQEEGKIISTLYGIYCVSWHLGGICISNTNPEAPQIIINKKCAEELLNAIRKI